MHTQPQVWAAQSLEEKGNAAFRTGDGAAGRAPEAGQQASLQVPEIWRQSLSSIPNWLLRPSPHITNAAANGQFAVLTVLEPP